MGCGNNTTVLPGSNSGDSASVAILNGSSMPMNASMVVIRDSDESVSTLPNYDAGNSNNQTVNSAAGQDDICVLDFLSSFPDVSSSFKVYF